MKPRLIAFFFALVSLTAFFTPTVPATAWWQFVSRGHDDGRIASARYNTEKECKKALQVTEASLKKAHPNRYPLVGSCEEYR